MITRLKEHLTSEGKFEKRHRDPITKAEKVLKRRTRHADKPPQLDPAEGTACPCGALPGGAVDSKFYFSC